MRFTNVLALVALPLLASADVCTLINKVNAYRLAFNLNPLVLDVRLVQIAQEHSEQMSAASSSHHDRSSHQAQDPLLLSNPEDANNIPAVFPDPHAEQESQAGAGGAWYAEIERLIPNWTFLAENVGMGSKDENAILDLFKSTEEYNHNLLSDEATLLGIGEKDGYWTFEFAGTSDGNGIEAVFC
ncbi:hypothetical protein HDU77_006968 [Chytriomyces hyalinus]|nr:hypothetical protein HDU77_006968 [Chytriomyces hyalinus]